MKRRLIVTPAAEHDLMEAAQWYEGRAKGLGAKFLLDLDVTFDAIRSRPGWFPTAQNDLRRSLMKRFPYAAYFLTEPQQVTIVAVRHTARDSPDFGNRA